MTWIQTYTGKNFYPLAPRVEDIDIEDIAHALSQQCRFSGHTAKPYSVAEHSWKVADLLPDHLQLHGLLHDASEAYLVDMPSPIKRVMPEYRDAEAVLSRLIYHKYGLTWPLCETDHAALKRADLQLLMVERERCMGGGAEPWPCLEGIEPPVHEWRHWCFDSRRAETIFLARFNEYMRLREAA